MITQLQNPPLFYWLNHAAHALPDWLWASLTITGHTSMAFALVAPLLLVQRGRLVLTALFVCTLLGGVVATLLKESFQMPRPPAVLAESSFHLIGHKLELVSFPSGHTLTAFAVAALLVLGLQLRGWRLALCALVATAIGLSRIAVGAHWPLDVLAGAITGILCAILSLKAAKILHFKLIWLNKPAYGLAQIGLILLVSTSLFATAMGYPQANFWQLLIAVFGVIICLIAAILHLKSIKSSKKALL